MPTYVSYGFEYGAPDLPSLYTTSGSPGAEASALMLWSGFATSTFSNLQRQDQWTTHASFIGTGTDAESDNTFLTGERRLGFWNANRGRISTSNPSSSAAVYASGSLVGANANARSNKLNVIFGSGAGFGSTWRV